MAQYWASRLSYLLDDTYEEEPLALPNPHPQLGKLPRPSMLQIPDFNPPPPSPSPLPYFYQPPKRVAAAAPPQQKQQRRRRRRVWDDLPTPIVYEKYVPQAAAAAATEKPSSAGAFTEISLGGPQESKKAVEKSQATLSLPSSSSASSSTESDSDLRRLGSSSSSDGGCSTSSASSGDTSAVYSLARKQRNHRDGCVCVVDTTVLWSSLYSSLFRPLLPALPAPAAATRAALPGPTVYPVLLSRPLAAECSGQEQKPPAPREPVGDAAKPQEIPQGMKTVAELMGFGSEQLLIQLAGLGSSPMSVLTPSASVKSSEPSPILLPMAIAW